MSRPLRIEYSGAGQGEKALSGGMGAGGKRPRGIWALALCGGENAG